MVNHSAYATKMADGSEYILQFSYTNLDEPIRSIKTNHESKSPALITMTIEIYLFQPQMAKLCWILQMGRQ